MKYLTENNYNVELKFNLIPYKTYYVLIRLILSIINVECKGKQLFNFMYLLIIWFNTAKNNF